MLWALVDRPRVEAALLRPLTDAESPYISELCDQASALLRTRLPTIDDRLDLPDGDPEAIGRDAVAAMLAGVIKRYLVNPTGATTISKMRGPFQESTGFGARPGGIGPAGDLVITDADIAKIDPPATAKAATIYTRGCRV